MRTGLYNNHRDLLGTPGRRFGDSILQNRNSGIYREGVIRNSQNTSSLLNVPSAPKPAIQMQCAECEEESIQMKPQKEKEVIQMNSASKDSSFASPEIQKQIQHNKGNGHILPAELSTSMGRKIGADFQDVSIHTDSSAHKMASQLGARAFTHGNDIYFNQGNYNPDSTIGKHLLAHELTHVVQQTGPMIQKEKMPAPSTVANLESYGATTRQNIKYDPGNNLQKGIKLFFKSGIVTTVRSGYNVNYVVKGFPASEIWVESALKALALYTFNLEDGAKDSATTNFTTVQHLDLSGRSNPAKNTEKGPDAYIRFTSTQFDSSGKRAAKKKNVQLLIEKISDYTAAATKETAKARRKRYENDYQIYNTAPTSMDPLDFTVKSMNDSEYDKVLEAIDHLPKSLLNSIKGIPIHKGTTDKGANGEVGEYINHYDIPSKTWTRKITVYKDYFKENLEQRKFTMVHELGHAVDYRPNEMVGKKGGASGSASKEFRKAVKLDGGLKKGVSTYGATTKKHAEYYAEAFSMYQNYPNTFKALRANVYEYFKKKFP